ncbi:unnamed protein product [Caenorhabditis angaria]|uniref:Vacuolar protein sorting-associated protein 8 central domain-containing protein n=1 Tax=Caenorhabditis angaria TaxID=860376 RepID=A0A9P1N204_9PELO|nr:unnamed protein product [Caenorhabditis angaria]
MSSKGSGTEDVEDWLDIGNRAESTTSLNLDDVLVEIENLEDGLSEDTYTITEDDDGVYCESPSLDSDYTYHLDSDVVIHSHQSISRQIAAIRVKSGPPVAIAEKNGQIAIVTSKGHVQIFDLDGKLDRYYQGGEEAAACLAFSLDSKYLAVGFSKGTVKILNVKSGAIDLIIQPACQPGLGILQILYITGATSFLTLDTGGSVYELRVKTNFAGKRKSSMRCVFSGCNGEVVNMRMLPHAMLALLTVSKLLLVSTRFGGKILGTFAYRYSFHAPPLFTFWQAAKTLKICVTRGKTMNVMRLASSSTKSATLLKTLELPVDLVATHWISRDLVIGVDENGASWQIEIEKGKVGRANVDEIEIVFATSDFKGLATGSRVSEAMFHIADRVCYQSIQPATSTPDRLIILSHDGLKICETVTEWEQLERFRENDDEISAALYLLDVVKGKRKAAEVFRNEAPNLLRDSCRKLLDCCQNGCDAGKVAQLTAHYRKYIKIILKIAISAKFFDVIYQEVWSKISLDQISKSIFFEFLDDFVLDGLMFDMPPAILREYLENLANLSHFSQFQLAVVRFPIYSIDIHQVMTICRANSLYDGIIYVMNNALMDYISPLEEMLDAIAAFAGNEVLSDNQIECGNRLLLYLNCCLAGRAYPIGSLPKNGETTVPLEIYRCITSLRGKDGKTEENYPYLRLLLQFDPQQFVHVISTVADAKLFQTDGRLQRITDTIGLICVSLRKEQPLVHFLLLVVQLTERGLIAPPVEMVQDAIISLLRIATWQSGLAEPAIIGMLRAVGGIDRTLVLRAAQAPIRPTISSFLYLSERRFLDLLKSYIDPPKHVIFASIDQILQLTDLTSQESAEIARFLRENLRILQRLDAESTAKMMIQHGFLDWLRTSQEFPLIRAILRQRQAAKLAQISGDDELDEQLFGVFFEGSLKEKTIDDAELLRVLRFWSPTGSRSDFCLNLVAQRAPEFTEAEVFLLESRGHVERGFERLFAMLEAGEDLVRWLDECLNFCCRHSTHQNSNAWMIQIFRHVASGKNSEENLNEKLKMLVRRIIDSGTEHAEHLVTSLLDCRAFSAAPLSENLEIVNEILASCEYEKRLLQNVLRVQNAENSALNRELYGFIGRRAEITDSGECATCQGALTKSAYVFRCGHFQHIECATSSTKLCPCQDNLKEHQLHRLWTTSQSTMGPATRKRDIFAEWSTPLDLLPKNR